MSNKNICLVYTSSKKFNQSVYDDCKEKGGVMYMTCPQTGSEIPIHFKNEKERLEWIELKKEIRNEIKVIHLYSENNELRKVS